VFSGHHCSGHENPTRMHIVTHLSDKYEKMRNSENGWSEEEAGMAPASNGMTFTAGGSQGPTENPILRPSAKPNRNKTMKLTMHILMSGMFVAVAMAAAPG
jgi:hypothetical protein